jgi:hypothetical protein
MAIGITAISMTFHMFYVAMGKFLETLRGFSDTNKQNKLRGP